MGGQPGKPKPIGNPPIRSEPQRPPIEEPPKPIPTPPVERPPLPAGVLGVVGSPRGSSALNRNPEHPGSSA